MGINIFSFGEGVFQRWHSDPVGSPELVAPQVLFPPIMKLAEAWLKFELHLEFINSRCESQINYQPQLVLKI